ncbi:hypothetical protein H6G89_01185 [Oscillatoria sp. FACHB-1407]|uniref:hypothetical protein n=1 Tax=Oscillatoria sp. FACHB-1407 TaxID=2692847 RepID=UPI0016850536|nr:hypothetical protein [Oscillatoria sp. FACHB-1407]MBD2459643.1 hypothetical protein [Oscillatoria sp. FACHB-1407]
MAVLICPGVHSPELTDSFLANLNLQLFNCKVFPGDRHPAYSGLHILKFIWHEFAIPDDATPPRLDVPLLFVSFSAGVVGAIAAAWAWRLLGGEVKAFIALDGWGVPLSGDFPIYRVSHDDFTHWSSALLGAGQISFYADPAVEHLELWRSPHTAMGYTVDTAQPSSAIKTNAAGFIASLLVKYGESGGRD